MSLTHVKKVWNIAERDQAKALALAESLKVPPIVAHLLILRGQETHQDCVEFLNPGLRHLSDPFLLTDMDKAVARITQARDKQEKVLVFGDYDVDGTTAMAILINALRRFGVMNYVYGMPLRLTDGYGINPQHVEEAHENGVSLIITVDNGIAALDAANRAKELGVDLIVTDHHSIECELPHAVAVINPKREDPSYPGYSLCGAGVAFKLSTALNGTPNDLDIAAVGTVADIVPLLGENRAIVTLGLRHMMQHRRIGLDCLAQAAGISLENISSENIGFQLGPRINAAGRLYDATQALHLLLSDCPKQATDIARTLDNVNNERRDIERDIYDEAIEELEAFLTPEQRGIVLGRRGWHAGVIGIVASRLVNRYHRPSVIIAIDESGIGRGSARCIPGFDMLQAISECQEHLIQYGGHKGAAGFSIEEGKVDAFRLAFETASHAQLGGDELSAKLDIDVLAAFSEIDASLLNALSKLEPLGHANPAPVFASMSVEIPPDSMRILSEKHIKCTIRQDRRSFQAIGFGMAERFFTEPFPRNADIAFCPQFNTWRGETSIQLVLKDIRPA